MCENKAVLYGKMAQVMGILNRVKETGKHQQGWRYATSEDVKDAVRVAMAEVGLALLVSLEDYEVINLEKGILVRGTMAFTLCCSETGATETRQMVGEAADQAKVSDKAFYKLYTTLEKYYLKTTFLISSGEELDSDSDSLQRDNPQRKQAISEMTLAELLTNLEKIERIKGFYSPSSIMACRPKSPSPPDPDDIDGWRVLFTDARDYALEQLGQGNEDAAMENRGVYGGPDQVEKDAEQADQPALIDPEPEDEGQDMDDHYGQMFES